MGLSGARSEKPQQCVVIVIHTCGSLDDNGCKNKIKNTQKHAYNACLVFSGGGMCTVNNTDPLHEISYVVQKYIVNI